MGYIWGVFESMTEAAGDAAEVRVAYQLGKSCPATVKLAGYKSMFAAFIMSIVVSFVFISLINILPPLLTWDKTIQDMLVELFPLVALGNVTMSMGMVCWLIVGA
jgi:Na+-driven multidrug efflux pump